MSLGMKDIREDEILHTGNIILEKLLSAGMTYPEEFMPKDCIRALQKCDEKAFATAYLATGVYEDLPVNRTAALIYALFQWYRQIYN